MIIAISYDSELSESFESWNKELNFNFENKQLANLMFKEFRSFILDNKLFILWTPLFNMVFFGGLGVVSLIIGLYFKIMFFFYFGVALSILYYGVAKGLLKLLILYVMKKRGLRGRFI